MSTIAVTLPGTLTPKDYWLPDSEHTLTVNYPPPAQAWFVVYEVNMDFGPRTFEGRAVIIGKHPVLWVMQDVTRTNLRFFAEIPLDVALQWPNYADYRGSGNE